MRDELQHHGILGMKWGIRRYQPYPSGERVKGGKEVGAATKVKQRKTRAQIRADEAKNDAERYRKAVSNTKDKVVAKADKKIEKINAKKERLLNDIDKGTKKYQEALDKKAEKRDKKLNSSKEADARKRLVDDGNENIIGIRQPNGDILFIDRKLAEKNGFANTEKETLNMISEKRNNKKSSSISSEEKALVKELLNDLNKVDYTPAEIAEVRELLKSMK